MKKISLVVALLALMGCQDKSLITEQANTKPDAPPTVSEALKAVDENLANAAKKDAVTFKAVPVDFALPNSIKSMCKTEADFEKEEIGCPEIDIKVASVEPKWIERDLNLQITRDNNPAMIKFRRDLRMFAESQEGALGYVWNIEPEFVGMHNRVAQFSVSEYMFLGGAHGVHSMTHHLYDLDLGSRIALHDIELPVRGDGLYETGKLYTLAETAYRNALAIEKELSAKEIAEHIKNYPFEFGENFYFDDKGLVLSYDPYALGPYAMGSVKVPISYDKLVGIIRSEYLPHNMGDKKETL